MIIDNHPAKNITMYVLDPAYETRRMEIPEHLAPPVAHSYHFYLSPYFRTRFNRLNNPDPTILSAMLSTFWITTIISSSPAQCF